MTEAWYLIANLIMNKMIGNKKLNNFWSFIPVIIIFMLLLSGCGSKSENKGSGPQQQAAETEKQEEKPPEQLKKIETSIEKIIFTLNGPSIGVTEDKKQGGEGGKGEVDTEEEKTSEQTGGSQEKTGEQTGGGSQGKTSEQSDSSQEKTGEQSGSSQEKTGEQSGSSSEEKTDKQAGTKEQSGQDEQTQSRQDTSGKSDKQAQTTSQGDKKDPWVNVKSSVNGLHYQWNDYMPSAIKKGAGKTVIDNFSKALNDLTDISQKKDRIGTLIAANKLYMNIPDLYSFYSAKSSSELKRIRYYTRDIMLNSMISDWKKAEDDMNNLKTSWLLYKNTLDKDKHELSNTFDMSIYELEKVIKDKSQSLTDIKGSVVLNNIQVFEKAAEKQASEGSKSGGK